VRVAVARRIAGLWTGFLHVDRPGEWTIRVTNYAPSYRHARLRIRVRTPEPVPPPNGFGPLGGVGCNPASPRNTAASSFPARGEVFGTSLREPFWALVFSGEWTSPDSAVLAGLVGKRAKIVFRWPYRSFPVVAVGPAGRRVAPTDQTFHTSSTWSRPGYQWGTIWELPEAGCWRFTAAAGGYSGDVWILVRS
jgi:hypothetical protein